MVVASYAIHKYISLISQNIKLTVSDLLDFVLHRQFFDNSLITNLMIIIHSSLTPIIILLHDCYDVTFCIWIVFVLCLQRKKLIKQTNKTVTRLAKRSFKLQSKNTLFNVMQVFMNNYMNDDSIWFFKHQYRINMQDQYPESNYWECLTKMLSCGDLLWYLGATIRTIWLCSCKTFI